MEIGVKQWCHGGGGGGGQGAKGGSAPLLKFREIFFWEGGLAIPLTGKFILGWTNSVLATLNFTLHFFCIINFLSVFPCH